MISPHHTELHRQVNATSEHPLAWRRLGVLGRTWWGWLAAAWRGTLMDRRRWRLAVSEVFHNAPYVLASTEHWRPLLNGHSGFTED